MAGGLVLAGPSTDLWMAIAGGRSGLPERTGRNEGMLDALRQFIADLTGMPEPRKFGEDDYRLAAAALLYHATAIDGVVSDEERAKLHELLKRRFALDDPDTDQLVAAAEAADSEAVDLYGFTSVLKRSLEE